MAVVPSGTDGTRSDALRAFGAATRCVRPLLSREHVGFTETARTFEWWLLPPPTSVTVILNVGQPFGGLPGAFVAGLDDTYSVVAPLAEAVSCVDVKLTPLGAYQVLGPLHELSGHSVDLDDLVGEPAGQLLDAIRLAPDWPERFALLDRFLAGRAATGPVPAPEITYVWRRLTTGGSVRVGALAAEVGWSHKHLISRFKQQVGLPPRTVARLARFNTLLRHLAQAAPVRWGDLVEVCGYYDQAHLDRDFRAFAGTTRPTSWPGACAVAASWATASPMTCTRGESRPRQRRGPVPTVPP